MTSKVYNLITWFWHKILRHPIRMQSVFDNHITDPDLTVIFLHGIAAESATWRAVFHEISQDHSLQNVRLVALDLLGFGKSLHAGWLDYDYYDYITAINHTIKHLKISSPVVLVGHSMGALIAANYATSSRASIKPLSLILVSPPVLLADELAHLPDKIYTKTYGSLHQFAKEVPAAETLAHFIQRFSSFRSNYLKAPSFQKSMDNIILNHDNYKTFTNLKVPTLLLHGHFDPLVLGANLRLVAKNNPHYVTYQSVIGHHDISVGKRVKIIAEIKKGLKDAKAATS